jgi:hypothetical protein
MATFEDPGLIAHHEGGHVVCSLAVGVPIERVTLRGVWMDRNPRSMRRECIINWGGPLADHDFRPTTVARRRQLWEREWSGDRRNLLRIEDADRIVHTRWSAVAAVAEALIRSGELTGDDVAALVKRCCPTPC